MQKCPNCGTMNRAGVLICEKCGTNLVTGKSQTATKSLGDQPVPGGKPKPSEPRPLTANKLPPAAPPPSAPSSSPSVRGTDEFPKGGTLRLEVEGSSKSIQVPLTVHHREIVLGRRDPATGALPDIDLTPFAGYRMGVSRRHSLIRYSEGKFLDLFDQGSSNGTYLNDQRMDAHYPYRLHNGDRIRLGQITIRMHFEPGGTASTTSVDATPVKATAPLVSTKPPVTKAEDVAESTATVMQDDLKKREEKKAEPPAEATDASVIQLGPPPAATSSAPPAKEAVKPDPPAVSAAGETKPPEVASPAPAPSTDGSAAPGQPSSAVKPPTVPAAPTDESKEDTATDKLATPDKAKAADDSGASAVDEKPAAKPTDKPDDAT